MTRKEEGAYAKLLYDLADVNISDKKMYNKIKKMILKKYGDWDLAHACEEAYDINAGIVYGKIFPERYK